MYFTNYVYTQYTHLTPYVHTYVCTHTYTHTDPHHTDTNLHAHIYTLRHILRYTNLPHVRTYIMHFTSESLVVKVVHMHVCIYILYVFRSRKWTSMYKQYFAVEWY